MNPKVKISVAVGILVVAGGVFFWFNRGGAEETLAKSDDTKTSWMCAGCQATFDLTAKEVTVMAKEAGGMPLVCSKCKEKRVYRAVKCAKCGTLYFTSEVPDSTGVCPKCNPDAPKAATVEEQLEKEAGGSSSDDGKSESADPAAPKKPRKIVRGA